MNTTTSSHRLIVATLACAAVLVSSASGLALGPQTPGTTGDGVTLLPNGWRISPAGRAIHVGDFPMSMVATPDGRQVIISNNGWSRPSLTIVDVAQGFVRSRVSVDHAWLGLAWHPDGRRLYSSGAAENTVNEFAFEGGDLKPAGQFVLGRPAIRLPAGTTDLAGTGFIGGLAVDGGGRRLYAVHVLGRAISSIDLETSQVRRTVDLPAEPYTALLSRDGRTLFVSLWGGARVIALDPETLETRAEVAVGEHPNAMALSQDGNRLFVACANTNKVWVIDLPGLVAREQLSVALFPDAPPGSTPNALAVSPDGETLAVANADNNTVALVDIKTPGDSDVEGFVPTGWYPTAVLFGKDGRQLFVLNGKGLTGQANPRGPQPTSSGADGQYQGQLMQGALSIIDVPDAAALEAYTRQVYDVTPYSDATRLRPAGAPEDSPIPQAVGDTSPIKHVFYVIRENRTYDQVLGDMEKGNGDRTLTLFGEEITPNAHALAREFVLFDNFYVDAEVSYDGHAFSTGAYATDVVEKLWPTNYGRRGAGYLSEGGYGDRNAYGNLAAPPDGYIWDFADRAGVTVRSYGEFAERAARGSPVTATVPGLQGKVHPAYPPYDLSIPDNDRIDVWLEEFRRFESSGDLPRLNIIRLGNDHTSGTRLNALTPRAMVADNDLALGRLVDAISHSRFWSESAIFVLEDDAQNGPDHVDSHRSVALAISPYSRRGALDSTLYTTSGMLRTMELILGLPPMSQYDAAATPMYGAFQGKANRTPYTVRPARVSLEERNGADAWGSAASMAMNFSEADMTPEYELNEIIWKSVRGADSPMPPPVRAAFIRVIEDESGERRDRQR
jgi:DNA-binding beta-propeller fold protein YncE